MPAELDSNRFQAGEVEVLHRVGGGLEDNLELGVFVEAVRVLAVAAVSRATAGLDVGDGVRLGAKHAQEGFRVHGSGADLQVVGLLDNAALLGPKPAKREY